VLYPEARLPLTTASVGVLGSQDKGVLKPVDKDCPGRVWYYVSDAAAPGLAPAGGGGRGPLLTGLPGLPGLEGSWRVRARKACAWPWRGV
jgi:hypothetical protein